MSGTKIAIVVLVIVVLLFVGMVVYGVNQNRNAGKSTNKDAAKNFDPHDHSTLQSLGGILGPHAPKLKLAPSRFDLSHLPPGGSMTADAPKDDEHDYRKATFRPTPATCVKIDYTDEDSGPDLQHQIWPAEGSDPKEANFTVSKDGGHFVFTALGASQPCVVELE